jgi:hypothetical protein
MTKNELVDGLRNRLYGECDSIREAYTILWEQCRGTAVMAEVHMLLNTIANEIEKLEEGETVQYTDDPNKWYELDLAVVKAMAWGIFRSVDEATPFVDDLYDHHIEYVRGLDQDRLIELVRAIDPDLLEIVEV